MLISHEEKGKIQRIFNKNALLAGFEVYYFEILSQNFIIKAKQIF